MEKTLGGDRLGAGGKNKVELHGYGRSTHDLGYLWRSTMSAGTLVPFMCEVGLPGDTFDIDLNAVVNTHPTIGPLFGSFKMQHDIFVAPIRLYNAVLHNNALNIGRKMSNVKLPWIELTAMELGNLEALEDIDNAQTNPSCLLAYLGIRGIGVTDEPEFPRKFNATSILMYWDIYKQYYANKQEEIGAVIHTPAKPLINTVDFIDVITGASSTTIPQVPALAVSAPLQSGTIFEIGYTGTPPLPEQIYVNVDGLGFVSLKEISSNIAPGAGTTIICQYNHFKFGTDSVDSWRYVNANDLQQLQPEVTTFPLTNIDNMRMALLAAGNDFSINDPGIAPYRYLYEINSGRYNVLSSQEGLGIKTYNSDLFNNWISTEWIDGVDGISAITAIDTSGGSFKIDTLNISNKVYNMLNRIAVADGSYQGWLDAVYTNSRHRMVETPWYAGGLIKEVIFQEVISNAENSNAGQPLGTLAGKGRLADKHKGGKIVVKIEEPSYILGIVSLTPRVDYSQGNKWDVNLRTIDDFHKPALDQIGYQELITEQMAWWETTEVSGAWVQKSAGKQPAWINYMTNTNVVRGNFAIKRNEMFMTLNRRYETKTNGIKDLTTYIDPAKFNNIFAQTSLDAQNFWVQIAVDIKARRVMSAKVMPNL
ncbi:MAG: major capsid protein [Microviridae sp.]|nr:MAG: major capsid protein [Microviridae sp.]